VQFKEGLPSTQSYETISGWNFSVLIYFVTRYIQRDVALQIILSAMTRPKISVGSNCVIFITNMYIDVIVIFCFLFALCTRGRSMIAQTNKIYLKAVKVPS
jgi:hypothetical protein